MNKFTLFSFVLILFSFAFFSCGEELKKADIRNVELYYYSGLPDTLLQKLLHYIQKEPCCADTTKRKIQIAIDGDEYDFKIVIEKEFADDENFCDLCKQYARQLSQEVFQGKKVIVHLCNEDFETLKEIRPFEL